MKLIIGLSFFVLMMPIIPTTSDALSLSFFPVIMSSLILVSKKVSGTEEEEDYDPGDYYDDEESDHAESGYEDEDNYYYDDESDMDSNSNGILNSDSVTGDKIRSSNRLHTSGDSAAAPEVVAPPKAVPTKPKAAKKSISNDIPISDSRTTDNIRSDNSIHSRGDGGNHDIKDIGSSSGRADSSGSSDR
jgi:hypothetical protein